jgi:hypothetical protein
MIRKWKAAISRLVSQRDFITDSGLISSILP